MIRVSNIRLPIGHGDAELKKATAKALKVSPEEIKDLQVIRLSVDARKKPALCFVYTVDVRIAQEERKLKANRSSEVKKAPEETFRLPEAGDRPIGLRPIVIGSGPAGLFCGYMLARAGFSPLILERGGDVDTRTRLTEAFWAGGTIDPETNVSFGEGGAGTYSDGKLATGVRDNEGFCDEVLRTFVRFGAPPDILYLQKPHIGTDRLRLVVKAMREEIIRLGGEVRFHCRMDDVLTRDGRVIAIRAGEETIPCSVLVMAAGHSARDTFTMLSRKVHMEPKAFAVGLRIEHPQAMINETQYGKLTLPDMAHAGDLPQEAGYRELAAASYKLTAQTSGGRGVYSFCMCPGGFVVNASSEAGGLCVNGMSNYDRAGENANSALVVTVSPGDFPDPSCLGGMDFQRRLEQGAFRLAGGKVPVQLLGDFVNNRSSTGFGAVTPQIKGAYGFGDLRGLLPDALSAAIIEALPSFDRRIKGFAREDAVFSGIESRTSSPVKIPRDEAGESSVKGLYPCGEGAGYAGGITSAAMDGIRTAMRIIRTYSRPNGV